MSTLPAASIEEYFQTLDKRFIQAASKGVKATFQIELTGPKGNIWVIKINDGSFILLKNKIDNPTVSFEMDADLYLNMMNGGLNLAEVYSQKQLLVKGNLLMAQKFMSIFPQYK